MGKFIIGTFLLLGWGFYVMSGGSDFEPQAWPDQVAESQIEAIESNTVAADVEVTRNDTTSLTSVAPEPLETQIVAVLEPVVAEQPQVALVAATPSGLDLRAVAGTRVNMREGPGTDYGVIETLAGGTEAEVIEINAEGWARVRLIGTNQTGWMAERLLNPI